MAEAERKMGNRIMHRVRNAILVGDSPAEALVSSKEPNRRRPEGASLAGISIAREERRTTDQRSEERYRDRIERGIVVYRGKKCLVRIVNVSTSGLMIEADFTPRIGESLGLEIEGMERLQAAVRWIREGRIGLDVGEGTFAVD